MTLDVSIGKLRLKNPLILASGILGSYSSSLNIISKYAGAVVTKSVSFEKREGYKNPVVINWKHGLLNAVGLANMSAKDFSNELKKFNKACPLIVSIYGYSAEDISNLTALFPMADAFEINLSCPHVKGLGADIAEDQELVKDILAETKKKTRKPVFAKIPYSKNIIELGKIAEECKIDGVVAINTIKGLRIDIKSRKPVLSNIFGGVSGEAIKPMALKCVWDLYEEIKIPIIGVGGITTYEDVIEFILAGASAVQIGSAFFYSYKIIKSIKESLESFTRVYGPISELIGAAHRV